MRCSAVKPGRAQIAQQFLAFVRRNCQSWIIIIIIACTVTDTFETQLYVLIHCCRFTDMQPAASVYGCLCHILQRILPTAAALSLSRQLYIAGRLVSYYRIAHQKCLYPADNLPLKIRHVLAAAGRDGFLPVNCRPGETFLSHKSLLIVGFPPRRKLFWGRAIL